MSQFAEEGRLTADAELRFTNGGMPVASFTIAVNKRVKDSAGNWTDGDTAFWRCSCFRDMAENVVNKLSKGDLVVAIGRLDQKPYQTKDGEKRTSYEVTVDAIGPSLKWKDKEAAGSSGKNSSKGLSDEPPF